MNNFGLGLVLTFTDNATSGMQRATGAFNDLNNATDNFSKANNVESALLQVSYAAGIVGDQLYSVGQNMTGMFANLAQGVINTGTTMLTAQTQLSTLYGSAEQGASKLAEIQEYAKNSIFNFEDLIPSVIMLKANGIEAFDNIASSAYLAGDATSKANQTLMDYASDLAAFNPQMRNAYGTGVQAAIGAINEYIAEGNAMSLKRGASLDINALLGEDTAGTIEERSRQIADLIEKLNMVGTTASLAETPMQRLSNVEDTLFNLAAEVSSSGVYDKYSELIAKITDYIFAIPDSELSNIANVVGGALSDVLDLLNPVVDKIIELTDRVREFIQTNPKLVQSIVKWTALAGVLVLVSGVALKLASSIGMLKFSLSGLFSSSTKSKGFSLLGLFKNLSVGLLPLIAITALVKAAWDRDFMGMQETVKNTVTWIVDAVKLIFDAFADNTLSEDNFKKAQEMGILPLIEGILQLKYHWDFFISGLKKGFDAFFESLAKVLTKLGILDVDVSSFGELIVALIDKMTAPGMTDTWEQVGYLIGKISGWVLIAIAVLPKIITIVSAIVKIVSAAVNIVSKIITFAVNVGTFLYKIKQAVDWVKFLIQYFWATNGVINVIKGALGGVGNALRALGSTIINFLPKILSGAKSVIMWVLTGIGNIVIAILGAFGIVVGLPAWAVGLITVAIIALIALIIAFWDEIKAFFVNIGSAIAGAFQSAWEWFSSLPWVQSVINFVSGIINTVVSACKLIGKIIMGIVDIIKTIALGIWGIIKSIANVIKNIVYAIYEFVRMIVLSIAAVFKVIWIAIKAGLQFVHDLFTKIFNWIYDNVIEPVVNAISSAFNWVWNNVISPVIEKIGEGFNWLKENIFTPVADFFKDIIERIADKITWLKGIFSTAFEAIKEFMTNAIEKASDIIMPIINAIKDTINDVIDGIKNVIDNVGDFFEGAGDFFKGVGDNLADFVGLDTGGYVKETGIACLHPNEVVVNDVLTQRLSGFLADYKSAKTTSSPLITQDVVATDDYKESKPDDPQPLTPPDPTGGNDNTSPSPMRSLVNNTTNNSYDDSSADDNRTQDNSVTFEQGSVVIQIEKGNDLSDEELNSVVDSLMKKMARKLQLRDMQTRK